MPGSLAHAAARAGKARPDVEPPARFKGQDFMIRKKIAEYLAGRKYINGILENPPDLSVFGERPTARLITGLVLMGLSYVIGWPAVAVLGVLATWYQEPMIAVIGCPATYALSCAVFIFGAWLARAPHYLGILVRYAIQILMKKLRS